MVDSSIKTVLYRTIIQNEREMSIVKCTTVPPGVFRPKAWKSPGGQDDMESNASYLCIAKLVAEYAVNSHCLTDSNAAGQKYCCG